MLYNIKALHLSLLFAVITPNLFGAQANAVAEDPYAQVHKAFGNAATKNDYQQVIKDYGIPCDIEDCGKPGHKFVTTQQRAIATTNRGEAKLALGDLVGGFIDRDARAKCPQDARLFQAGTFVTVSKPLNTKSEVKGATVAVYCDEGGFGDIFFFVRFMKELKNLGAKVIAVATKPMVQKILNNMKDEGLVDETALFTSKCDPCTKENTGITYDYDIHMMSLPTCVSQRRISRDHTHNHSNASLFKWPPRFGSTLDKRD